VEAPRAFPPPKDRHALCSPCPATGEPRSRAGHQRPCPLSRSIMARRILLSLTAVLAFAAVSPAQGWGPPGPPPGPMSWQEASAIAIYWINAYLRRPASPDEVRYWAGQLRGARSPADVLAALLASPEYAQAAGSSRPGYIRQLVRDVGHRDPNGFEI